MKLEVFEVLEKVSKAKTKKEKIDILRNNNVMSVRDVLQGAFDNNIKWNLPEGAPPYTPNRPESIPSTLLRRHLDFKYFVKGLVVSEKLNSLKREQLFVGLLESIHPKDAEILLLMVSKKPPVKGLTKKLVQEAYPDLIPE